MVRPELGVLQMLNRPTPLPAIAAAMLDVDTRVCG